MSETPLVSVVIPCMNEDGNLSLLYDRLTNVFADLPGYTYELIFVDDGSTDASVKIVRKIKAHDPHVHMVQLSRNFGKEIATTAGLHHAKGDAAVMIDADLQHPPEVIPQLLTKWREGFDVVVGKRSNHEYTSRFKRVTSRGFYGMLRRISQVELHPAATDFRLVDRRVIDEFNRFTERNRLTRGLIDWLGFSRAYVDFKADKRAHGKASYSFWRLIKLALASTVSMTFFPLYLAGYLGGIIMTVSVPLGVFVVLEKYVFDDPWKLDITGTALLAILLMFLVGLILACLGLMSIYIANIHGEVINRPLYVVRRQDEQA